MPSDLGYQNIGTPKAVLEGVEVLTVSVFGYTRSLMPCGSQYPSVTKPTNPN